MVKNTILPAHIFTLVNNLFLRNKTNNAYIHYSVSKLGFWQESIYFSESKQELACSTKGIPQSWQRYCLRQDLGGYSGRVLQDIRPLRGGLPCSAPETGALPMIFSFDRLDLTLSLTPV